ncbi:MAG: YbjQ family protein [Lachnospiraceae bacterium]|nr:YbjQ family protein [Lachnospiraceae bacterium]
MADIKNKKARFLCNTGYNFEGYHITEYIGLVSSEIALGTGFLTELSMSINDALGSQSNAFEEKMSLAKKKVLDSLMVKAMEKRANAVIGLKYDIFTLANNMLVVSLNATAVYIEKSDNT